MGGPLKFYYVGNGTWGASACVGDKFGAFRFRINVLVDGSFAVSNSSIELRPSNGNWPKPFRTLGAAKRWCNRRNKWMADHN